MDRQHFRDPSLSARTMIQASVTIVAQEQRCDALLRALRKHISVVRGETGCLGCWLYQDVEELDALTLVEEWDSAADLRCRLQPDQPVFDSGSSRPNAQFQLLCRLAEVKPKQDIETGEDKPWVLKDLRKTCATYYDAHMPESSIEILGHSVGGVTYRHYAHRDPLAHRAILSLPQPSAFNALLQGFEGECPCCRRRFGQALST